MHTPPAARPLRFGVNYVPSRNWWHIWQDWDEAVVRDDLAAIASLGLDHIRIHCLWPVFQPDPAYVSETALRRLSRVLELAGDNRLGVVVTVLDGWLSGWCFLPGFVHSPVGNRSIFTDRTVVDAQRILFSEIVRACSGSPSFLGLDLGNEINVVEHFVPRPDIAEGDRWAEELFVYASRLNSDLMLVNGVDHNPWFRNTVFSRRAMATAGTHTSVHAWVKFTGATERYPDLAVGRTHIARYAVELAAAYAADATRPVWLQEFGVSREWIPEDTVLPFAEATVAAACDVPELWGMTWWCSHDIDRGHAGFNAQEYDLGLLRTDNSVKPIGEAFAAAARRAADERSAPQSRPAYVIRESLFDSAADGDRTVSQPQTLPGWRVAAPYLELLGDEPNLALIHEDDVDNAELKAARGIGRLIYPANDP